MAPVDRRHGERQAGMLGSLQAGRGLAASAVLTYHAAVGTNAFVAPLPGWLTAAAQKGQLGVDFFFVLSGFIILNAHFADPSTLEAVKTYAFKRLVRIYVPYLPVSLALIAAYLLLPGLSRAPRDWGWLSSLLLLPSPQPPALVPAWTLIHEMLFYAIFVLYFADRRLFAAATALWTAAMLAALAAGTAPPGALAATLLDPINLEFVFGMAAALVFRLLPQRAGGRLIAAGLAVMLAALIGVDETGPGRVLFGGGAALLVLGVAESEVSASVRRLLARPLVRLGDASYALYLTHDPVVSLTSRVAARLAILDTWPGGFALSIGSGVLVGIAYHYLFERPALRAARRGWQPQLRPAQSRA